MQVQLLSLTFIDGVNVGGNLVLFSRAQCTRSYWINFLSCIYKVLRGLSLTSLNVLSHFSQLVIALSNWDTNDRVSERAVVSIVNKGLYWQEVVSYLISNSLCAWFTWINILNRAHLILQTPLQGQTSDFLSSFPKKTRPFPGSLVIDRRAKSCSEPTRAVATLLFFCLMH